MFGKLKDKLKGALSVFSKKAEEEAVEDKIEETIEEPLKEVVQEKAAKKKEPVKKESTKLEKGNKPKGTKKSKKEATSEEIISSDPVKIDQVKITYFVHGTTIDNEKEVSSGWSDVGLSELGIKQSVELKNKIKNKKFEAVFCSDLKRAIQSAELTFKGKVKIIQDKRLRECNYGKYNGKSSEIVELLQENKIYERFPNGESYEDVKIRIADLLNHIYENYCGKHIAIVAHKAPQLAIEILLNHKTWEQAFAEDWRKKKAWQPGWEYIIKDRIELPKEEKKGFFGKLFAKKKEDKEDKEETEDKIEEVGTVKKEVNKKEAQGEKTKSKEHLANKDNKEEPAEKESEIEEIEGSKEDKSFFGKIKQSITTKIISEDKFNDLFWELEIVLLENNVSVEVIERIKDDLKKELVDKPLPRDVAGKIQDTLQKTLLEILTAGKQIDLLSFKKRPLIIAFFGINGTGKTTSIAKLTNYFKENGKSVVLAAGDTFRAAAIQQLEEHANILGVKIIKQDYGSDAAAVAFDAIKYAEKNNIDVVLIDTAGRLHSNTNLMAELKKIIKVTRPDLKIFVGESITGNDCIEQARQFNELVEMDGVILTKADVDEKGGAPLSIAYTIKKPILFLGIGQKYNDLEKFDADKMLKRLGF